MIIYQSDDGVKLDVRLENKTVWLNVEQIAELFNKGRSTINEHILNIFKEGELDEKVVCRKFRQTTQHGAMAGKTQSKEVKFYNLDVIISVGYRVKSIQGTRFRQWATERLNEYIVKGFTMDDERLKNLGGGNYWKESCKISCTMLLMGIQRQKLSMSVRMPTNHLWACRHLTPVEEAYLESINALGKIAKRKRRQSGENHSCGGHESFRALRRNYYCLLEAAFHSS